jgi:hypothetical protein
MEKEDVTTTVTLLGIVPDDPPRILIGKRLSRGGKTGRLFQQMVPVPDADLFARLIAQVGKGDAMTATVTTEWHADGYKTYLSAFTVTGSAVLTDPEQTSVVAENVPASS